MKIPFSDSAERSTLGALILNGSLFDRVGDILVAEAFYADKHRVIFESMVVINESGVLIDAITIADQLEQRQAIADTGGLPYLIEIAEQSSVSAANIEKWADVIREAYTKRLALAAANQIIENTTNDEPSTADEIIEFAESTIMAVGDQATKQRGGPRFVRDAVDSHLAVVVGRKESGRAPGLMTGFIDFDRMTGGLKPGNLVLLAGVPGAGKTSFALNIATNISTRQPEPETVVVFSMEMPESELHDRNIASVGGVSLTGITQGTFHERDYQKIVNATVKLKASNLVIDETGALTPGEIRSRARRIHRQCSGIGLIVIDYLQLMKTHGKTQNRNEEMSQISKSMKSLAKELSCPIIALSQLNRGYANRADKRPVMSDLRDSGSLEQDADLLAFLYTDDPDDLTMPTELIIRKQRAGPTGTIKMMFEKIFTRFQSYADHDYGRGMPQ